MGGIVSKEVAWGRHEAVGVGAVSHTPLVYKQCIVGTLTERKGSLQSKIHTWNTTVQDLGLKTVESYLKLSDKELVVVLARFNRNLRSRKMSDILCGDLRVEAEATDEAVEAPEAVVLSLGLPTSRVPMKQCVSAMIFMGFRAHFFPWYVFWMWAVKIEADSIVMVKNRFRIANCSFCEDLSFHCYRNN